MRSKLLTLFMAVAVVVALAAEFSVAALAYQGNANKSAAPAKPKAKKRKKPASHAMSMPATPEGCLNRLATLAAREPLPNYEGEPSKIINEGMLWTDGKAKCPVTDQAQRLKLLNLANKWRANDAAGVRSALQEMGATASPTAAATGRTPRSRRGRRSPATEEPPAGIPGPPPTSGDTQVAPSDETSGASNTNMRRARPRRRPSRRNANTANSNS